MVVGMQLLARAVSERIGAPPRSARAWRPSRHDRFRGTRNATMAPRRQGTGPRANPSLTRSCAYELDPVVAVGPEDGEGLVRQVSEREEREYGAADGLGTDESAVDRGGFHAYLTNGDVGS